MGSKARELKPIWRAFSSHPPAGPLGTLGRPDLTPQTSPQPGQHHRVKGEKDHHHHPSLGISFSPAQEFISSLPPRRHTPLWDSGGRHAHVPFSGPAKPRSGYQGKQRSSALRANRERGGKRHRPPPMKYLRGGLGAGGGRQGRQIRRAGQASSHSTLFPPSIKDGKERGV